MRDNRLAPLRFAIKAVVMAAALSACADRSLTDLDAFMDEKRALPGGVVEPIPTFEAYEAFAYAATTLRSPFDRPMNARQLAALSARTMVRPDESRTKDYLERFSLDALTMVGTMKAKLIPSCSMTSKVWVVSKWSSMMLQPPANQIGKY